MCFLSSAIVDQKEKIVQQSVLAKCNFEISSDRLSAQLFSTHLLSQSASPRSFFGLPLCHFPRCKVLIRSQNWNFTLPVVTFVARDDRPDTPFCSRGEILNPVFEILEFGRKRRINFRLSHGGYAPVFRFQLTLEFD